MNHLDPPQQRPMSQACLVFDWLPVLPMRACAHSISDTTVSVRNMQPVHIFTLRAAGVKPPHLQGSACQ